MKQLHKDYFDLFSHLFNNSVSEIFKITTDLQKSLGKETKGAIRSKHNNIIGIMKSNSTRFFELDEILLNFDNHIKSITEFEVNYKGVVKIQSILEHEFTLVDTIQVSIKNIVKSGSPVITGKKTKKEVEEFSNHIKKFNRFIRDTRKELETRDSNIQNSLLELTEEIRITQEKELAREKEEGTVHTELEEAN
jgi:hypothetical protein